MPTRNVNLTVHYDRYLNEVLASGRYKNASEAVRAGLRLLEYQDQIEQAKLQALRDAFKEGVDAIDRGAFTALESDAEIDRYFDALEAENTGNSQG